MCIKKEWANHREVKKMKAKTNKNFQAMFGILLFIIVIICVSGSASAFDIWGTYDGQAPTTTETTPATEIGADATGQAPADVTTTDTTTTEIGANTNVQTPTTTTITKKHEKAPRKHIKHPMHIKGK